MFLFLTHYLQQNLGFSPVRSGIAFLPLVGALAVTATTATSVVVPRLGPRSLVMAPSMTAGTFGVHPDDAGVASALVNTAQQAGGLVGTAVLSSIAASALVTGGAVHSYTTTYAWVAGFFVAGAIVSALMLRSGPLRAAHPPRRRS